MSFELAAKRKRLRGVVLKLLCTNHDEQKSRFDSISLWSAMVRGLSFDVSQNELVTLLQDLRAREYIVFKQLTNKRTNEISIMQIELCPKGRDLLEETIEDPAVEL